MDRAAQEDDPLLQHAAEDVVGAFATARLFDDHGDERVHVVINGIAHRCLPLSAARNIAGLLPES